MISLPPASEGWGKVMFWHVSVFVYRRVPTFHPIGGGGGLYLPANGKATYLPAGWRGYLPSSWQGVGTPVSWKVGTSPPIQGRYPLSKIGTPPPRLSTQRTICFLRSRRGTSLLKTKEFLLGCYPILGWLFVSTVFKKIGIARFIPVLTLDWADAQFQHSSSNGYV